MRRAPVRDNFRVIVTAAVVRADGGVSVEGPGGIGALVMRVRFPRQEM